MASERLLWIDDKIDDYSTFVEGLAAHDLVVVTASSVADGVALARQHRDFDLFLVDLKMPEQTGFDAILSLARSFPSTPICVLSSYLHLDDYQRRLSRMRRSIGVLAKEMPDPSSPAFGAFADKLREFILNPPRWSPRDFEKRTLEGAIDPFDVRFSEYLNLPDRIKDALRRSVQQRAADALGSAFDAGSVWVLICGDPRAPAMTASSEADIPSPQDVITKAVELDAAPYQFSRPDSVDDFWYGNCRGQPPESGYPTVTLLFGSGDANSERTVHFDTGCPFTVMDYELLEDLGALRADTLPIRGQRGTAVYDYVSQTMTTRLKDQVSGSLRIVDFKVRAVKNWLSSPFIAPCRSTCSEYSADTVTNCANRVGLVGRNLLSEAQIALTLDGAHGKTSFGFEEGPRSGPMAKGGRK